MSKSILSSILLCTALIADASGAMAQGFGGEQGYVPPTPQQQLGWNAPQGNAGQFQGYVQHGQYQNQAASGMFPAVPAGTLLSAKLEVSISSGKAQVGDQVKAKLEAPLAVQGNAAIPAGSTLIGSVTQVSAAQNATPGSIEIGFRSIETPDGRTLPISTEIKKTTGNAPSGSHSMVGMPNMYGRYGMGTMAMGSMYMMSGMGRGYGYGGGGGSSAMVPMMAVMGGMTAATMVASTVRGMRNRGANHASEAKLSKGTQLQLMLAQPIMLAMPPQTQAAAPIEQQPQYDNGTPITYTQAENAPQQFVPGLVQ